jgi:hypothetical protein
MHPETGAQQDPVSFGRGSFFTAVALLLTALVMGRRRPAASQRLALPPPSSDDPFGGRDRVETVVMRPRRSRLPMLAAVAVLALLAAGSAFVVLTWPAPRENIRLAMFYHPPSDGRTPQDLARTVGAIILTRGDEPYRDRVRAAGFGGPILQYLDVTSAVGPARLRNADDRCGEYQFAGNDVSGIAGDFCTALHRDERNFLHNSKGQRLFDTLSWREGGSTRTRYYYLMNPGSIVWQGYFARRARENLDLLHYSGLFLDNIDLSADRGRHEQDNSDGRLAEYDSDDEYRGAVLDYLAALRGQLKDATLWANLTEGRSGTADLDPYLPYLDGVMNEYFVARWSGRYASPRLWETQIQQADKVLGQGKTFIAVAHGPADDESRMRFALASYLLVARDNAYFRYAADEDYERLLMFDDYRVELGRPTGDRYQVGESWRRDFGCGYVQVDVGHLDGDVELEPERLRCRVERTLDQLRSMLRG